jgi:hypothetical protein
VVVLPWGWGSSEGIGRGLIQKPDAEIHHFRETIATGICIGFVENVFFVVLIFSGGVHQLSRKGCFSRGSFVG